MAVEDYFDYTDQDCEPQDFGMFRSRNEAHALLSGNKWTPEQLTQIKRRKEALNAAKKSGKNKDIEWVTGQGEIIRIADMEDGHLGNTIRYIAKRQDEHLRAADMMASRGFTIPQYTINRRSANEWLDILGKEANRRKNKAEADAMKILGTEMQS